MEDLEGRECRVYCGLPSKALYASDHLRSELRKSPARDSLTTSVSCFNPVSKSTHHTTAQSFLHYFLLRRILDWLGVIADFNSN